MLKLELGVVKETMKAKAGVSYHINRLKMTLSNVGPELTCSLGTKGRPKPQETNVLHRQGKAVGMKISKYPKRTIMAREFSVSTSSSDRTLRFR